ncbi:M20/M25/M40 family metallo-hydrolase [Dactylosporangium sp. AC04546]|uniref:M20 family metallopeptidase n=1 Tax=Dactylosporangium sp. AC04546 TaxID=2862460 RepID=UPI001EDF872D|nr:M20/M25/M40 family metallo-hydrolase [Dactylosporangium sp. AC04546]WVK78574.1 M20/M25/M40 family metallo-hydrolase [Dactylosporangium sp. AC04546]
MRNVEAEALALLSDLVRIDSVNPGLVPAAAGEAQIVEHLRSRLHGSGFVTTVVPAPGRADRPSLVAVSSGPAEWPTLVLNGHLDTVGVAGMPEPFAPRLDGDRLFGRGAADMKGGVAAIVAAAEHLVATKAPVRPVLALVADEEDASLGSEAVIDALPGLGIRPDACLIAEPTDLALSRSLRGFAVVRVSFTGRAAHSSQAELGVNAVTHLGRLLHAVDERAVAVRAGGGDLMVTVAHGGESPFVVPDHAECLVEVRTTAGRSSAGALDEVRSLLEPQWNAAAELVAHRDGWQLDATGPAAGLSRRLGDVLGTGPTFDAPYWMEAPLWQQVCPTLVCGPSGGGLHAVDEWVDVRQVRALASALTAVLSDWRPHAD